MGKGTLLKANNTLTVTINKDQFLAEVQKYVDLSPVFKEYQDIKAFKYPDALVPPQLWTSLKELSELIKVVTAAVEVAKTNLIKEYDPDGALGIKFDKNIALAVAVELLKKMVTFTGWLSPVVNRLWPVILNLLVSIYVNGLPKDWVSVALTILGL